MHQLLLEFERTGNLEAGSQALALHRRLTKPYIVRVRISKVVTEIYFEPMTSIEIVDRFTEVARACQSVKEFEELESQHKQYAHTS